MSEKEEANSTGSQYLDLRAEADRYLVKLRDKEKECEELEESNRLFASRHEEDREEIALLEAEIARLQEASHATTEIPAQSTLKTVAALKEARHVLSLVLYAARRREALPVTTAYLEGLIGEMSESV